jgi:hypothetical protein
MLRMWIATALFFAFAPALASSPYRGPIIDMHMHSYGSSTDTVNPPNPVTGEKPTISAGSNHMTACLQTMKQHHVVLGIVNAGDEDVASALAWHDADPGRIIAGVGFDGSAARPVPDIARLSTDVTAGRYKVMGEIGAEYAGKSLSDPVYEPILALAEKYDLPVGVHTGISAPGTSYDPCCRSFRTVYGNPQSIEEALNRHPKLRIYLMHAGWPYTQETVAIMSLYPQVYADLAVIDWIIPREEFHAHLRALIRAGLGKRLMFGSDQMRWPQAIGMAIEGVDSATFLTDEQKQDIFCRNAGRFLRLKGAANPCASGTARH